MAIQCSGAGYYVFGSTNVPDVDAEKTVCARLYTADATTLQTYFNAVNATTGVGYQLGIRNGLLTLWSYGGATLMAATMPVAQWTHVAYTRQGLTHTFYFDGAVAATVGVSSQVGAVSEVQIFGNQWNENFSGQVEDLRLYGRALDQNEILSVVTTSSESNVYDIRCHWPMLEQSKNTTVDQLFEVYGKVSSFVGTKATGQSGNGFGSKLRGI